MTIYLSLVSERQVERIAKYCGFKPTTKHRDFFRLQAIRAMREPELEAAGLPEDKIRLQIMAETLASHIVDRVASGKLPPYGAVSWALRVQSLGRMIVLPLRVPATADPAPPAAASAGPGVETAAIPDNGDGTAPPPQEQGEIVPPAAADRRDKAG